MSATTIFCSLHTATNASMAERYANAEAREGNRYAAAYLFRIAAESYAAVGRDGSAAHCERWAAELD